MSFQTINDIADDLPLGRVLLFIRQRVIAVLPASCIKQ
ncbi:MAG: hypothetical protein OFPI_07800 [Osedax symbiont Rs2]|nr:MAG: hypothetical protein OFPI_07800 [Osedax symbiont Rs2]